MRLRLFISSGIWDYLLVCILALALNYAVLSGFDSTIQLRSNFLLQIAVLLPLFAIMFAGSWSKRFLLFASIAAALWFVVVMVVSIAFSSVDIFAEGQVNDVEGNYSIFGFATLLTGILTYLLTRRFATAVAYLVFGLLVCGCVQFLFGTWLEAEGGLVDFAVFLSAAIVMIVYQRYRSEAAKADFLVRPAFAMAFIQGLIMAAACLVLGFLSWVFVVSPLGFGTPVFEPFSRTIMRPVVEYSGIYDQNQVENLQNQSDSTNDNQSESQQNAEGGTNTSSSTQSVADNPLFQLVQSIVSFNSEDWDESLDPTSAEQAELKKLLVWVVPSILILCIVFGRIGLRFARLRKWGKLPKKSRVQNTYHFLAKRLSKLGFKRLPQTTPLEFAFNQQNAMVPFTKGTGKTDFVDITLIYQRAAFGHEDITDEEWNRVKRYYMSFFNNAHAWVGNVRWLWYFWRI